MERSKLELGFSALAKRCIPEELDFKNTKSLPKLEQLIGQDRAYNALAFGIDIKGHGYHIYAIGPVGTGKSTNIRKMLELEAKKRTTPDDWLYVNNFENRDTPKALRLPAGKGREFQVDMDQMVEELKTEVPKAFENEKYQQQQEKIEQDFEQQVKELFQVLEKKVEEKNFVLLQTTHGLGAFPVVDAKVLMPEQLDELEENKQKDIKKTQQELQLEIRDTLRQVELLQKERRKDLTELDRRVVGFSIDHLIASLKSKYEQYEQVLKFLTDAREFMMKNIHTFKQIKQSEQMAQMSQLSLGFGMGAQPPTFDEYRVNLIVDNSSSKGAPVIFEKNPIGPDLIGRIEQQGVMGALVTNFRMIKSGALHKANGGYLVIEAMDLLQKPFSWQLLKRALKTKEISIENMLETFGAFSTKTLEPEPIPLDVKVILIGEQYLYYLLYQWDQDFNELFKVKADFATYMARDKASILQYAQFIASICNEEKLKHFDVEAVAKVVEYGSRMVDHQKKLSTKFGEIVDLIRQANYWANKNNNKFVQATDVVKALDEKVYRSNRIEEIIQEMIDEGTILIDTKDQAVGQINGLSVLSLGDYSFGKPAKITCVTHLGSKGVISIDREVQLGGKIHNKGAMIISAYLGGKYAQDVPLTLSASISFEQLYDEIEGDSASSAEIYILLSSLSGFPIRQDIAVTGSVNQFGQIQPIGGANEKIEGFYEVCKSRGLTGKQGVIIPKQNVIHLMLKDEVVDAVKNKKFHIYAVSTIDEGIEILTGKKAGAPNKNGNYPKDSVHFAVQDKIISYTKKAKDFKIPKAKNAKKVEVKKQTKRKLPKGIPPKRKPRK